MQASLSVCGPDKVSSSTPLPAKWDRLMLHFCKLFCGCRGFVEQQRSKEKEELVSPALQQYGAQRAKSPGRKVKVTSVITPPAAQTAEPRCSERDTSRVDLLFCIEFQHCQLFNGVIYLSIQLVYI